MADSSTPKATGEDTAAAAPTVTVSETAEGAQNQDLNKSTVEPESESDPLLGAVGGVTTTDQGWGEEAPPLPQKMPLPGSQDNQTPSRHDSVSSSSSSSSDSSGDENEDAPREGETHVTTVIPTPPSEGATGGTQAGVDDVAINMQASSPNEPPPPYPGGPVPGADPYGPPAPQSGPNVVTVQVTGNCPKCQVGNIMENFSFCGICLAIWLFPCGLICLFCMRNKRCSHCGASF